MTPEPYELALLALAAARLWKLIGDDRVLDRPRDWLLGKMTDSDRQTYWGDFLVCPWCFGFHACWVLWLLWLWQPLWTLAGCTPFALSAVVGLFGMVVEKLGK